MAKFYLLKIVVYHFGVLKLENTKVIRQKKDVAASMHLYCVYLYMR